MRKIGFNVFCGIEDEKLYPLAKEAGFDTFFSSPHLAKDLAALTELKQFAEANGLVQETVHSTIDNCRSVWWDGPEGDQYIDILLKNIEHCRILGIPILVVHPQCDRLGGYDVALGLSRLDRVVEAAGVAGIQIAFENIDSAELLNAVMERYQEPHVGFCYDTGHECWLTPDAHWLRKYGDRLLCTHFNDNDRTGDLHWIPYDGAADFDSICRDMRNSRKPETISIELGFSEKYSLVMTEKEFLEKCYSVMRNIADKIDD